MSVFSFLFGKKKKRGRESGWDSDNNGFSEESPEDFQGDFSDDFADDFADDFTENFAGGLTDGFTDDFSDESADGLTDDFGDDFEGMQDEPYDEMSDDFDFGYQEEDLKEKILRALWQFGRSFIGLCQTAYRAVCSAIEERLHKEEEREPEIDDSYAEFADDFDKSLDEGFERPQPPPVPEYMQPGYYTDEEEELPEPEPPQTEQLFVEYPQDEDVGEEPPRKHYSPYSYEVEDDEPDSGDAVYTPDPEYAGYMPDSEYAGYMPQNYTQEKPEPQPQPEPWTEPEPEPQPRQRRRWERNSSPHQDEEPPYEGETSAAQDVPAQDSAAPEFTEPESEDYPADESEDLTETDPDGESVPPGGLFASVRDLYRRFRRRLPSFRPKVYFPPQSQYAPEQDGIQKPTLASDIQRILEERNRPDETEQEYDRMRNYIRSVSTDARIRPQDIKAPDNLSEVRAAENELYDLIDMISSTNEQQRSRIGVYEQPPEEDPYNYRGINNDRQFYADMESYSFTMDSRYGFESEENIDPTRKSEYYRNLQYSGALPPHKRAGFHRRAEESGNGNTPGGQINMPVRQNDEPVRQNDTSVRQTAAVRGNFNRRRRDMPSDYSPGRPQRGTADWDDRR